MGCKIYSDITCPNRKCCGKYCKRSSLEGIHYLEICWSKTSRTLKIDLFKIPDNKNIWKLFSKHELLFLDQANFSSDPSQIMMLQFSIPRASLLSSPCLWNFTLVYWSPFSAIFIIFFIGLPILSYHIQPQPTTSIGYTKPCEKRSQSNLLSNYMQVIIPFGSNTLLIKEMSL